MKYRVALFSILLTALTVSQGAEGPTELHRFDYRLTDVGSKEVVDDLYAKLRTDIHNDEDNSCNSRAQLWSYQMLKDPRQVYSGKIFVFYSVNMWNWNGKGWWFHVAPYVVAGGKEYVMEKYFDINQPLEIGAWLKNRAGGRACIELKSDRRRDWKKMKAIMGNIPKNYSFSPELAPCYYRKAPMYYDSPIEVYNHDVQDAREQNAFTDIDTVCADIIDAKTDAERQAKCAQILRDPSVVFPTADAG